MNEQNELIKAIKEGALHIITPHSMEHLREIAELAIKYGHYLQIDDHDYNQQDVNELLAIGDGLVEIIGKPKE